MLASIFHGMDMVLLDGLLCCSCFCLVEGSLELVRSYLGFKVNFDILMLVGSYLADLPPATP